MDSHPSAEGPAEGIEQNAGAVEATIPVATTASNDVQPSEPASTPTVSSPSVPTPAKPDVASLLGDPEFRQAILKDKELRRSLIQDPDVEHHINSEAGRRAKAEMERLERHFQQEAERQRLAAMDEYELGVEYKKRLEADRQKAEIEQQLAPYQSQTREAIYREVGSGLFGTLHRMAQAEGVEEKDFAALQPQNYPSLEAYAEGAVNFLSEQKARRLAKPIAKTEAAAMLEDMRNGERDKTPSPVGLPSGEAPRYADLNDVHVAWINGDFGRQDNPTARKQYRDALSRFGQKPEI